MQILLQEDNVLTRSVQDETDSKWIILVIESNEAIVEISKNKTAMPIMKDILEKYYEMNVLVMFTNIANNAISFNAPEIMKMIKDNKSFIIFEDIGNIKLVDVPVSVARKNSKALEKNDAYVITDGELKKLKVII